MRSLLVVLLLVLGGCTATATPIAESIAAMDKIHTADLDAFADLVKGSTADQSAKDWYLGRIEQNRAHLRALTDQTLVLVEAIGKVDWQSAALRAWQIYRSTKQ